MASSIRASVERAPSLPAAAGDQRPRSSQLRSAWRRLRSSKQAMIGAVIVLIVVICALFASVIAPENPGLPVLTATLKSPQSGHWFGTDELGRDVFGRIVHGARVSLRVAALAVGITMLFGVPIGLIAGFWGRYVDAVLMRLMDAIQAFPMILLAIAIASTLGPGITNATIAIGVVGIPGVARLARGETLRVKSAEYVTAARASGSGTGRILIRHILPNGAAPLIVAAANGGAAAILTEAALSFVGLGAAPPNPSWGSMLQQGYPYVSLAPWLSIFPGLAISLTTFGFIFLGDGLRDIFDPKLRNR